MKINKDLLNEFEGTSSKILAVTKYLNKEDTKELIDFLDINYPNILEGYGENRIKSLIEKNIPREKAHFIGNIQTKEIKEILKYAETIHSVDSKKHILKMEDICFKSGTWVKIFLQINLDSSKISGIKPDEIPEFLKLIGELENVSLIGFSAIGKDKFSIEEKQQEFDLLIDLKNKYIPNGIISAGTSIDYKIALEKGIQIIRIGTKLYE